MFDLIGNLALGFETALSPTNLFLAFIGCLVGTLIGVLPGVGPIATIAMLMPLTFKVDPTGALIMLAGIYYGAQYGGSTTAILVNIPGEVTSVMTAIDGHEMAKKGQAGIALGIAAIGSFFAGTVATLIIAAIGAPLTKLALLFGPAEYFALMVLGLGLAIVLARGSVLKAVIMVVFGLLLATVGTDLETGQDRLTLGIAELSDGIDFAVLAMGVFGIAEILRNIEKPEARDVVMSQIGRLLPSRDDLRRCFAPIVRGTGIGSVLGILPGNGAVLGPFASYALEKKLARDPSRFGKGAIEGVAGPESANNAGAQTAFIPLLTLGIPPNAVMALMVGAMTIHGLIPGPAGDDQVPESVLGNDRLDVDRKPHAADHQPAADRAVGAPAQGAVPSDVHDDRAVLLHRDLLDQQQSRRRVFHRVLRPGRIRPDQARARAGADAARFRAGQAHGRKAAAGPGAVRG